MHIFCNKKRRERRGGGGERKNLRPALDLVVVGRRLYLYCGGLNVLHHKKKGVEKNKSESSSLVGFFFATRYTIKSMWW